MGLRPSLASASDAPGGEGPRGTSALRRKMDAYLANGAQLGWLLLPEQRAVEIWRAGAAANPERLDDATTLDGGELFPGLALSCSARARSTAANQPKATQAFRMRRAGGGRFLVARGL